MTCVKVKLRKSTVIGKAGAIYYQLCHLQKSCQITTKIKLRPEQWNADDERVILSSRDNVSLLKAQGQIDHDTLMLRNIISDLENHAAQYTVYDIVTHFQTPASRIMVLESMVEQINQLKARGQFGTARNYQRAYSSFATFLEHNDLSFAMFTDQLISEYGKWLERRRLVRNSISFYMRILRSIYNKAVTHNIVSQTFPFKDVYTGIDRTAKRAVNEKIVADLLQMDLSYSNALSFARDMFIFSYCMRGMAFIDIAYLQKKCIYNGYITYYRKKTGQRLVIRIEPCIEAIIDRYKILTQNSQYVFPIITACNASEAFRQYQTSLGYYNRILKKLSLVIGLNVPISSYTPRHTWATTARNHNIPLSVISAGMGHTSEKTTQIYLASLDNSIIDAANEDLIHNLNRISI